jgi:hypothetical protein
MKDDILPPWQKISKPKSQPKQSPPPKSAPDQAMPKPEISINLPQSPKPSKNNKKRFHRVRHHWYNFNKAEKIMALSGVLLIIASVFGCALYVSGYKEPPEVKVVAHKKPPPPKPTTVASPLTGAQIDPALSKRPVTGIMIENSLDARPQSGLQDAGIVFEAIAEGGITRFIALFQETRPAYIGPVRSLRPYYIDFATPFDAAIAHVGGSPEALAQIRSGGKDLDQFFNSGAYWRQPTRDAPHNVYTSFDRMDALNQSKGYISSTFIGWPRKTEAKLKTTAITSIDLAISSSLFNARYDYDAASNSYMRSEGGKPHIVTASADDKAGVQLHPKVVIALVMDYGIEADGKHSEYQTSGSGKLYVFQDGGMQIGTWSKADRPSQFVFTSDNGTALKLDPGQTWVSIVSAASKISYKP